MSTYQFTKSQKVYFFFKRCISIFGAISGILVCTILLWWWVLPINIIVTKGHPIYRQERYGKNERVFKLLKFRSMKLDAKEIAPSDMSENKQHDMTTKFGAFLRKSSIDETLQLFNILWGHMAFVGPRPGAAHNEENLRKLRKSYTPSAFDVKPGITGLAQIVMHRNHDADLKAKYDSEYVKKMGFWFDTKIFIKTFLRICGR